MLSHGLPVREYACGIPCEFNCITHLTPSSFGCINTSSDQSIGFLSTLYASIGFIILYLFICIYYPLVFVFCLYYFCELILNSSFLIRSLIGAIFSYCSASIYDDNRLLSDSRCTSSD